MSIDTGAVITQLATLVARLGVADKVNKHEPKDPPGKGVTVSVWAQDLDLVARASGTAATSVRQVFQVRFQASALQEPRDLIDPNVMAAVDAFLAELSGGFTLGGEVAAVDLLGAYGQGVRGRAGYVTMGSQQNARMFRLFDLFVPVVHMNVWSQSA